MKLTGPDDQDWLTKQRVEQEIPLPRTVVGDSVAIDYLSLISENRLTIAGEVVAIEHGDPDSDRPEQIRIDTGDVYDETGTPKARSVTGQSVIAHTPAGDRKIGQSINVRLVGRSDDRDDAIGSFRE
jgi:hypothetical protein